MSSVAVVDYGMGNLHSISKALQHVAGPREQVLVTSDPQRIRAADRVVLPGVGAIRDCVGEIKRRELDGVALEAARAKPFLGVCVGMQALLDHSDENDGVPCLGLLPGTVHSFGDVLTDPRSGARLKVPHMGWNQVEPTRAHPLWRGIEPGTRFYFVHSYYAQPASDELCAARCWYPEPFAAAVARDNVFAVQFHPEKSHRAGLTLLANFLGWDGDPG